MERISAAASRPKISVVIRNRNEAEHLRRVLGALDAQVLREFEVVVVDNESSDDSVAVAEAAGAKIIKLEKFTYGRGLNVGIKESRGEIIVVLSAHSIPIGRYFLSECLAAMESPKVAAARLVYAGKGADMDRWQDPEYLASAADDFVSKGPLASGCVVRRSVWEMIPFDEATISAEDKIWAEAVLRNGYHILSPAPAFYFYSKRLTAMQDLRNNYRDLVAISEFFSTRLGFVNVSKRTLLRRYIIGIVSAFRGTVQAVRVETTRALLTLRFPKR